MAAVAIAAGKRVIAPMLSESDWASVVALAKRRELLMANTGLPAQAKTVRWRGGTTRFFSHFPGEAPDGYGAEESAEHAALKIAVFQRLIELGIPAELECGTGEWRADILVGECPFGPALAIEIQLSKQSAERTYERTRQRERSGVPTLWIFGPTASTGHLGEDLLASNPVFKAETPLAAADIAQAVCTGIAKYDNLEAFSRTPARPVAALIPCPCGTPWLSPIGVILLPNRVRGDVKPVYASCTITGAKKSGMTRQLTSDEAQAHLKRFEKVICEAGAQYKVPVGRAHWATKEHRGGQHGSVFVRKFQCPTCYSTPIGLGLASGRIPIIGKDLYLCPVPISCEVDARPALKIEPCWLAAPIPPKSEPTMPMPEWRRRFIDPLAAHLLIIPKNET